MDSNPWCLLGWTSYRAAQEWKNSLQWVQKRSDQVCHMGIQQEVLPQLGREPDKEPLQRDEERLWCCQDTA